METTIMGYLLKGDYMPAKTPQQKFSCTQMTAPTYRLMIAQALRRTTFPKAPKYLS